MKLDPGDRLHLKSTLLSFLSRFTDLILSVPLIPLYLLSNPAKRLARRCWAAAVRIYGWVDSRIVTRYVQWSERRADRHLAWARRPFGQIVGSRVFPDSGTVRASVRAWYASMPYEGALYIVKAAAFLLVTINAAAITPNLVKATVRLWESGAKQAEPREHGGHPAGAGQNGDSNHSQGKYLDPLSSLVVDFRKLGGAIMDKTDPYLSALADPLSRPTQALTAAVAIVLIGVTLLALRVAVTGILRFLPVPPEQANEPLYSAPPPRFLLMRMLLSLRVGKNRRYRPVVVLVNCLARVGAARQHYQISVSHGHPTTAPRVHLADAERIVWSAWRTRHTTVRRVHRAQYKEHAGKVVGALRAVEARQDMDTDTAQVLEDMARMLSTMAERYAQGRVLALLDPEYLNDVPRAVNREWVRLVVLAVVVTSAAVGVPMLGLSDAAATQVVGVVSLVAVVLLYGARLAPTDLLDVVRGQSRA